MVNEGKGRDPMRVALVHEWLVRWGGSESVLQSFSSVFPGAPIHTLVHRPDPQVADIFPPTRVLLRAVASRWFGRRMASGRTTMAWRVDPGWQGPEGPIDVESWRDDDPSSRPELGPDS